MMLGLPQEARKYIDANYLGVAPKEMAERLHAMYGEECTYIKVRTYYKNRHYRSGVSSKFEKGHVPAIKGRHVKSHPNSVATQFKAGSVPHNYKPVGTIQKNSEGYLIKKVQDKGKQRERWQFLHRLIWEEHNGPIPEGMSVIFRNGDRNDCRIENLMLGTKAEQAFIQTRKLYFNDPELSDTALAAARLMTTIYAKKRSE